MPNRNESRGNQGPKRSTPQGNPRPNKEERGGGEGTPVSANKSSGGGGGPASGGHGGGGGGGGRFRGQNQGQKRDHQNRNNADNEAQGSSAIEESGAKVEKKFTGRCRLFVGNLPGDINEANFKQMFEKFGEVSETFLNSQKGFGFIRLDTRLNAEAAKAALDGTTHKNRTIRVRFATHGAALRVKNIPNFVSNELLEQAFSMFGEVERAIVIVDDRGRPTKNGIVEFARKPGAQNALNRIRNGVFLLTISPYPVTVEPLEQKDEEDGNPERYIQKSAAYYHEREKSPRFAQPGAFEFEWGQRWKALEEDEKLKREQLEKNIEETREKTMDEMELARHEHQAMLMRQELIRRQEELQRLEDQRREFELRRNEQQRQRDERRRQEEGLLRQQQEEALSLRRRQDEMRLQQDLMRRQEEMMHMDQGSMRSMQGAGGPQPLMGGGGTTGGGPQGGNPDLMAQQMQGTQSRQSRFDQPPTGYNNGQNRGRGNQGGPIGAGGGQGGGQGGAGGPGGMGGGGPGGQQGGLGQAGRGPAQGGRGPNQGGPGNNMGGGPGAAYGAGGPNRPPMDEMRRQPGGERREIERVDRGRMDRREDYMTKRPRRF